MLIAAAALATGLGGGGVCAGSVSVGGTVLRVFFWCVVDAGYFLVGIQQRRGWWSDEESRT